MSQTILQTPSTRTIQVLSPGQQEPERDRLSQKLRIDLRKYEKLSKEQCGHLRHFHNIASALDGDFPFMGQQDPGQEWDTSYRYQLSAMAYAAGAAHYHRLPAMRSMFQGLIYKLIGKMLRREVWGYWYLTSQSGNRLDPDLKELRKPWVDPICRENIMYSGHILLMVSLYSMLFNDDSFDQPDSIVFDWNPLFFGMGPERYSYNRSTLQQAILKEMEREGWLGVCCEPNAIFIICNQFPMIAMRYNDVRNNTSVAEEVVAKYRAAWSKKGLIAENGLFRRWYLVKQQKIFDSTEISHTAWAMAFMPWNYDTVQSMYPSAGTGFLHKVDDRTNVNPPVVANAIKDILAKDGGDVEDALSKARELTAGQRPSQAPYLSPAFGYISQWLSEVAGSPELDSLLRHADRYLSPTWDKGGLHYARCNTGWDDKGNYIYVDPYTGNAAIGYARLNVKDGQKKMWDHPWTKEELEVRPWIGDIGFDHDVDCLRGVWDEQERAMIATFRTWNGARRTLKPVIYNLPSGTYGIYVDGELVRTTVVTSTSTPVVTDLEVGEVEVNLVVVRT